MTIKYSVCRHVCVHFSARKLYRPGQWSIVGGSCHKCNFCCDKSFVTTNMCLLRRKFCHNKHVFVVTKQLFCHDKSMFVATKLCQDKYDKMFVVTNIILSQQNFCHGKRRVLLWQMCVCYNKTCLWWQNICCDKNDTCGSSHHWWWRGHVL